MVKISVIVPVYNVQRYLAYCLDSLICQNFDDMEIICINDGSTDKSSQILDKYLLFDKRIKVITQKNNGLSAARNTGMKEAKGDYIIFVDSDDWVFPAAAASLYKTITESNADFVIAEFLIFNSVSQKYYYTNRNNSNPVYHNPGKIFRKQDLSPVNFLDLFTSAWGKIYKREFLLKNAITFPEGLIFEDVLFFIEVYLKSYNFCYINQPVYFYRHNRSGSIIQGGGRKYFDIFNIFDRVKQLVNTKEEYEPYKPVFLFYEIQSMIYNLARISEDLQDEFFEHIKNRFESANPEEYDFGILKNNELIKQFYEMLQSGNYKQYINSIGNEMEKLSQCPSH